MHDRPASCTQSRRLLRSAVRSDAATVARFRAGLVEGPLPELVAAGAFVKVLVKHPTASPARMAEVVEQVAGGEVTATYSMGHSTGLLELSAPGISKATTLAAGSTSCATA